MIDQPSPPDWFPHHHNLLVSQSSGASPPLLADVEPSGAADIYRSTFGVLYQICPDIYRSPLARCDLYSSWSAPPDITTSIRSTGFEAHVGAVFMVCGYHIVWQSIIRSTWFEAHVETVYTHVTNYVSCMVSSG